MKKRIMGIIVATGLLLLVSCGPDDGGPNDTTGKTATPTPIVVPTCTPTVTPTPDPAGIPTITEIVEPTIIITVAPTVEPTAVPEPTTVPEPTVEPTPTEKPAVTEVPEPTMIPQETITPSPEPTMAPQETVTPSPEPTTIPQEVTPVPSPTPAIDPEPLVNNGWQKTISIDEKYSIIFPERFRESATAKTNNELIVKYTCLEDDTIEFRISYMMQQTLEEVENSILGAGGTILEGSLEEKRVILLWQQDGMIYRGTLREEQYPQSLLGSAFGEEEWITGVMQVVFSYPAERQNEFETAEFSYYINENGEE